MRPVGFCVLDSSFLLFRAPVAQSTERRASNAEVAGESPAGSATFRRVSPTSRGVPLRTGRLRVRILHAAPTSMCSRSPRQRQRTQTPHSVSATLAGSTGGRAQAPACSPTSRGTPLKMGRVLADGHQRARSSKRAVRPISGIALDQCRDPERYRTCAPAFASWLRPAGQFRTPERETDRAVPPAGCEPVEETGQGFCHLRLLIADLRFALGRRTRRRSSGTR